MPRPTAMCSNVLVPFATLLRALKAALLSQLDATSPEHE